ncbi:hypothetical protein ACU4HD_23250 [Cupriavidus basilensis]
MLQPLVAHLLPSAIHAHGADLQIELAPFVLGGAPVRTAIRLDGVSLPSPSLEGLAGRRLLFPLNPEPGYIDGSIYVDGRHRAVDVSELRFGELDPHGLPVTLEGWIHFDDGARFDDTPLSLAARSCPPAVGAGARRIDRQHRCRSRYRYRASVRQGDGRTEPQPRLRHADMALLHARVQARLLIAEARKAR